jgi:hypothetical protein
MRAGVPFFLVVLVMSALVSTPRAVQAIPSGAPTFTTVTTGGVLTVTVTARYRDDDPSVTAYLRSTNPSAGNFVQDSGTLSGDIAPTGQISYPGSVACPVAVAPCVTVSDDVDAPVQQENITLTVRFACASSTSGFTTFILNHGTDSGQSVQLNCSSGSGGGATQVTIVATPNALVCGGTTTLRAAFRDGSTNGTTTLNFVFTTTSGQIVQTSPDTAVLTLLAGQPSATVTASTIAVPLGATTPQPISGTIFIQNYCGTVDPLAGPNELNVAVSASPNVVPCGGTSRITATLRDASGRIVPGVGFHFSTTGGGLLAGPPNTAAATSNSVELTLVPGMGLKDDLGTSTTEDGVRSVTVTATVGSKSGTVKVQQFCLGVVTDSSTAPGKVELVPANTTLSCGGSTFIGAVVRDSKGQVPTDANAPVNFLASSGTVTPNTNVLPKNGALNVTYRADAATNGEVTISAAAGATFGSTTIVVNCPFGAATTGAGGGAAAGVIAGSGAPPCPPGVPCIRPPNTGEAGLAYQD